MHIVFVDANVLFSRTLRDWLFIIGEESSMFAVHSTEDVLAETLYHLRRAHPDWSGGTIMGLRQRFANSLSEIVGEYDPTIDYPFNDPNDRHVHAAAVACGAEILLTIDSGFVLPAMKPFALPDGVADDGLPYEIHTADSFFLLADDSSSAAVMRATDRQRRYWQGKADQGQAVKSLANALRDAGCPNFAGRVEQHLRTLSGLFREHSKADTMSVRAVDGAGNSSVEAGGAAS